MNMDSTNGSWTLVASRLAPATNTKGEDEKSAFRSLLNFGCPAVGYNTPTNSGKIQANDRGELPR